MKSETSQLVQHPLALQLVPGTMPDEEFEAFCADIQRRGQRSPIVLYENKVLDGWHRYRACLRLDKTPVTDNYEGDDPEGLVIALNILRRRVGAMQRALAGARLCIDYKLTQDESSKRVGVSKVHINLVLQAINSKNARVMKMLENPDLTRAQLHEDLVSAGIVNSPVRPVAASPALSSAAAGAGLERLFANRDAESPEEPEDDLLAGEQRTTQTDLEGVDLDDVLGDPPSAGGKVISFNKGGTTEGGMPVTGSKPGHPERRSKDTPASLLADRFKGLTEADQISFMQLTWHLQRKLLGAAGLSAGNDAPPTTKPAAPATPAKASKATTAQAAKAAQLAASTISAAQAPAKAAAKGKGARTTAKAA